MRGGEAVLVDPCISAPEIAAIAADVAARGLEVRGLLITHADWDHVCGISAFPGVPAIMSRGAADRIASGQAAESVVREGAAEGLSWDGAPRADLVFEPGEALQVGPFTVETMALPGHTDVRCGLPRARARAAVRRRLPLASSSSRSCTSRRRPTVPRSQHCLTRSSAIRSSTWHPGHGRAARARARRCRSPARTSTTCTRSRRPCARRWRTAPTREQAIAAGAAVEVPRGAGDDDGRLRHDNAEQQLTELAPAA